VDRLISLNVSPSDIIAAIQGQNVQAAVGRIGARPTGPDQQFQFNLQTQGRLTTPQQFGDIIIRANPDGSALRVRDVARIELGAANEDTESRLNGQPAVTMGIYLSPGANAVAVVSHLTPVDPIPLLRAPGSSVVDVVAHCLPAATLRLSAAMPAASVVAPVRQRSPAATTSPRGSLLNSQTTVNTSRCSSTTWGRLA
jgi:hypothetical protein